MPPNAASEGGPFVRYTLPATEVRRLVSRIRATNEPFALQYTQLEGASGDEVWRRTSAGRFVTLLEDGAGGQWCIAGTTLSLSEVVAQRHALSADASSRCAADELVLQPLPASFWVAPLNLLGIGQSWNSYPVLDGASPAEGVNELHCYGS